MKLGYQDCGSWTFLKSTPLGPAQGGLALRPVLRGQDHLAEEEPCRPDPCPRQRHRHESFTERAPKLGGLVEFYRSPARVAWTPTGTNVPDYPKLAQLWWQNIGEAVSGEVTVDRAMDNLAEEMDKVMAHRPLQDPGRLRSQAEVDYDKLIEAWRQGKVK
jgi:glycerol transport system substrate-binding protein